MTTETPEDDGLENQVVDETPEATDREPRPVSAGPILPLVAVVGRPNVGKSTLINRFIGGREAIVHDLPGVTRDRLYLKADWNGRDFVMVDTGGIVPGSEEELLKNIEAQARVALQEADVVLFVVDAEQGPTPVDTDIAKLLRPAKKPVLLVANKADNFSLEGAAYGFYELGLGDPLPISALHGRGSGDLLDEVVKRFPPPVEGAPADDAIKVAIVGRPNVGKSSLTNALLGQPRMIVSPVSGTTRDAVDTSLVVGDQRYILVDTAGIRRRAKVEYGVEQFSVVRALKALERADVVVLVLDALEGVTDQDQRVAAMALEAGKPMVVAVNKWDALPNKDTHTMGKVRAQVLQELRYVDYATLVFISAKTGQRIDQILPAATAAAASAARRVTTGVVNQVVNEAVMLNQPPAQRGRRLRVYYASQVKVNPPTFSLSVNDPRLATDSYRRYLENKLREAFGFAGTPIRISLHGRRDKE